MTSQLSETVTSKLYDQDFCLWIEKTTQLLKSGQFSEVDVDNLIEELETMGRSEKSALTSNLRIVLTHLLKYKYQPTRRSRSWLFTLFEHRKRLREAFQHSPSLKRYYEQVFNECYQDARKLASLETGLSIESFPSKSPFTTEGTLDADYLPS